jgi:putative ubiquitin-RnfH superfamily antitoxin RatB of RatAB toxin-antitoxin module
LTHNIQIFNHKNLLKIVQVIAQKVRDAYPTWLYPEINLTSQKVSIFGKISPLDTVVKDGDRVEIYRQITVDPQTVQRRGH